MGDPVTTALIVGSGVMTARGQIAAGKARQNAANFNAQVSERNADIAEQKAVVSNINTGLQKKQFAKEFGRAQARTQQAYRYNGFVATGGTPALVALEQAAEADEQLAMLEYEGKLKEQGFQEEAAEFRMTAGMQRAEGAAAAKMGRQQAFGTLLQTGATVGMMSAKPSSGLGGGDATKVDAGTGGMGPSWSGPQR